MKKIVFTFFWMALLCISTVSQAQNEGSIKGKVFGADQSPLEYVSVSLYNEDGQLITGGITNKKGSFLFKKLPLENITVILEFLGFKRVNKSISLSNELRNIDMGIIKLQEETIQLSEAVVTAERSNYNMELDKKVFQVGKDLISKGGSVLDVLDQVPQVTVQPSGAVELRGNTAVQVLVNGRRSGLTVDNALEQISVENIDRIEVITNPSARYSANGSAGIINIILKKSKGLGFKGQIGLYGGLPANHMILPSISYKEEKFELFANYRWRYSDYKGLYTTTQSFLQNPENLIHKEETESRHDDGQSLYIGGEYKMNDRSFITLAYYRADTKDTDSTFLDYQITEGNHPNELDRIGKSLEKRDYNQLEISHNYQFAKKDMKLQTDVQYDFWNSKKGWNITSEGTIQHLDIPSSLRTTNKAGSDDIAVKSDFIMPVHKGELRIGAKWEQRKITNNYLAETQIDEEWITFKNFKNAVNYGENITGLYSEYTGKIGKIKYIIGLRGEHSTIKLKDKNNEYNANKTSYQLFPSAFLSYNVSDKIQLQTSASRRINRPSLWNLYPFYELTDINILQVGNIDLDPSYTNSFEMSLSYILDIMTINPGIYFRSSTSSMETIVYKNDHDFTVFKPINIDHLSEIGTEVSARISPMKYLSFDADLNYLYFKQKGEFEGRDMSAKGNSFRIRTGVNIKLPYKTRLGIKYQYRGPRSNAQVRYESSKDLSFSISKSFLENALTINVQGRNLMDSNNHVSYAITSNSKIYQKSRRYGPRYMIGITYKFNMTSKDRVRSENRGNR